MRVNQPDDGKPHRRFVGFRSLNLGGHQAEKAAKNNQQIFHGLKINSEICRRETIVCPCVSQII
jgi:hypothetical protein